MDVKVRNPDGSVSYGPMPSDDDEVTVTLSVRKLADALTGADLGRFDYYGDLDGVREVFRELTEDAPKNA